MQPWEDTNQCLPNHRYAGMGIGRHLRLTGLESSPVKDQPLVIIRTSIYRTAHGRDSVPSTSCRRLVASEPRPRETWPGAKPYP